MTLIIAFLWRSYISCIENHDQALSVWRNCNVAENVLLHFDAHIDYLELEECAYVSIGNFLSFAFAENIFNCIYWIIPEYSFSNVSILEKTISNLPDTLHLLKKEKDMLSLVDENTGKRKQIIITYLESSFFDKSIAELPFYCVDIDCDFFVNPDTSTPYSFNVRSLHNDSCYKLHKKLLQYKSKIDIVTISKSLNGGYTPLLFAYVSELLHHLFSEDDHFVKLYKLQDKGILALQNRDFDSAIFFFRLASANKTRNSLHLSSQVGLMYAYIAKQSWENAKKAYKTLSTFYPKYEKYLFPTHSILSSEHLDRAKELSIIWRLVSNNSPQSIIYLIKYCVLTSSKIPSLHINLNLSNIETEFEISFVLGKYLLQRNRYDDAILHYNRVLDYLAKNATPIWAGQISSTENKKNHGVIIAIIYEQIAIAYYRKKDYVQAIRAAKICRKMGRNTLDIISILKETENIILSPSNKNRWYN